MISVCIATYNGASYIGQQLLSILPQLGEDDEIVVSDDGSTDQTLDIIRSIADRRIRIVGKPLHHEGDNSPTANFENALHYAKGDLIFLADQDDVWTSDKVAVMTEALERCDCVVSDAVVTDRDLRVTRQSFYQMMKVRPGLLYNLLIHNGYTGCCMAFRRRVLEKALPFPKGIPMHDIWIGNVAAFFFRTEFIADRLLYFRRHKSAASCNGRGSRFSAARQFLFRWNTSRLLLRLWLSQLFRTTRR